MSVATAAQLAHRRRADRAFVAGIAAMGAAASWGAVHHALITPHPRAARDSWAGIATTLSAGIGLLFAASARATLSRRWSRPIAPLGAAGPALYVALAASGRRGIGTMLAAQSPSMAGLVALWLAAAARGRRGAWLGIAAIATSAAAAAARGIPEDALRRIRLDPDSAYHLAQIPGIVALGLAAEAAAPPRESLPE